MLQAFQTEDCRGLADSADFRIDGNRTSKGGLGDRDWACALGSIGWRGVVILRSRGASFLKSRCIRGNKRRAGKGSHETRRNDFGRGCTVSPMVTLNGSGYKVLWCFVNGHNVQ